MHCRIRNGLNPWVSKAALDSIREQKTTEPDASARLFNAPQIDARSSESRQSLARPHSRVVRADSIFTGRSSVSRCAAIWLRCRASTSCTEQGV
jgi:hypothetical protein